MEVSEPIESQRQPADLTTPEIPYEEMPFAQELQDVVSAVGEDFPQGRSLYVTDILEQATGDRWLPKERFMGFLATLAAHPHITKTGKGHYTIANPDPVTPAIMEQETIIKAPDFETMMRVFRKTNPRMPTHRQRSRRRVHHKRIAEM